MLVLCLVGCGATHDRVPDAAPDDAGRADACVALTCAPDECGAREDGCGGALDCGPCEIVCEGDADCETGEVCDLGSGGVCTTGCRTGRRAVIDIPAHPVEVRVTLDGQPLPETVAVPGTLFFEGDHRIHVARVPLVEEGPLPYAGRQSVVVRFAPGRYRARIEWGEAGELIEDIGVVEIDEDTTRLDFDLERVTSTLRLDLAPQWDGVGTVIVHSADFSTHQWAHVEDASAPITLLPMSPGRYFVTLRGSGAPNRVLPGTIELAEEALAEEVVVVEAPAAPVELAVTLAGGAAPDAGTCLRLQPLPEAGRPGTGGPELSITAGHARGWAVPGRYRVEVCPDRSWPQPPPELPEIVVPPEGLTAALEVPMVEVDVTVEIEGMDPAELPPGCVGEVRVGDHPLPLVLPPGEHRRVRVTPGEHRVALRGVHEGCPTLLPDAELGVVVADGAPLHISVPTVPLELRLDGAPALGAGAKWQVETGGPAVEWAGDAESDLRVVPGAVRVYYLPTDDDEATPPWPMGARVVFDGEVREPTTLDLSLDAVTVEVTFTLGGEPMPPLPPRRGGELPRPWPFLAFAGGVYFEEGGIRPVVESGAEWPRALGSWGFHDDTGAVASHVGWSLSPGRYVLSFEKRVNHPMRADSLFPVAGVPLGCWNVE